MARKERGVPGLALVDYDNLRKSWSDVHAAGKRPDRTRANEEEFAHAMLDKVAESFDSVFPGTTELDVRLYSGWVDKHGDDSQDAIRFSPILPSLAGHRQGIAVRTRLARQMMKFPELTLRGTVRARERRRRGQPKFEQKMVDGMIGCDAMFAAADGSMRVALVTGDDDFVPAALSAHAANPRSFAWLRPESKHPRLNDDALSKRGVCLRHIRRHEHA